MSQTNQNKIMPEHQHTVQLYAGHFQCETCEEWITPRQAWLSLDENTRQALLVAIEELKCEPVQVPLLETEIDWYRSDHYQNFHPHRL